MEAKTLMCAAELIADARAAAAAEVATAAATATAASAAADSAAAAPAVAAGADGQPPAWQQAADHSAAAPCSTAETKAYGGSGTAEAPDSVSGLGLQEALEAVCTVVTNGLEVRLLTAWGQ